MAEIRLSEALRTLAEGRAVLQGEGATVGEALRQATAGLPELQRRLFETPERLRSDLRLYVGEEELRARGGLGAALGEGEALTLYAPLPV